MPREARSVGDGEAQSQVGGEDLRFQLHIMPSSDEGAEGPKPHFAPWARQPLRAAPGTRRCGYAMCLNPWPLPGPKARCPGGSRASL